MINFMQTNKENYEVLLIGKKYIDTIISVADEINMGETNQILESKEKLGGIFNILNVNHDNIKYTIHECGIKKALIIEEIKKSKRTSFVKDIYQIQTISKKDIIIDKTDWIHICYVDDLENKLISNKIFDNKVSIDFCTNKERRFYKNYIDKSFIVFDSRERKKLYTGIQTKTPLIFHDENGSECVIEGKIVHYFSIEPIKNLKVNGAGDFFASFFIKQYLKSNNIEEANKFACESTTKFLWEKNEESNIA